MKWEQCPVPSSWSCIKTKQDEPNESARKICETTYIKGRGRFGLLPMPLLLVTAILLASWSTECMQRDQFGAWHTVGTREMAVILLMCFGLVTSHLASSFMSPGPIEDACHLLETDWSGSYGVEQRNWQLNWSVEKRSTPLTLQRDQLTWDQVNWLKGSSPSLKILKTNNDPIQLLRIYGTSLFLVRLLPPRLQILLWLLGFCDLVNRDRGSDQNIDPFLWHKWLLLFWETLKFGLKRGSGTHWNFPYSCPN